MAYTLTRHLKLDNLNVVFKNILLQTNAQHSTSSASFVRATLQITLNTF